MSAFGSFQAIPEHVPEGCSRTSSDLDGGTPLRRRRLLRRRSCHNLNLNLILKPIGPFPAIGRRNTTRAWRRGRTKGRRRRDIIAFIRPPPHPFHLFLLRHPVCCLLLPYLCIDSCSNRMCPLTPILSQLFLYLHTHSRGLATTFSLRCYSLSSVSLPRSLLAARACVCKSALQLTVGCR